MGSSISSVIAQLVMENLEESVLKKFKFKIPLYYRYVDDCIMLIPKEKNEYVLKEFNAFHKRIQFTIETQKDNSISFLDTIIYNTQGTLKTMWYTKKTWSSRYLNYNSNHPKKQKKSVIIGLTDRAISLSDPEYRENAIKKAKDALILNNYPTRLINKTFKQRIHKYYNSDTKIKQKINKKFLPIPL